MSISLNQLPKHGSKKNTAKRNAKENSKFRELLSKEISLGGGKYSDKKKEHFFSEMAMLLEAGVDIRTTLEIMKSGQAKEKDLKLISGIYDRLIAGASLSEAMEAAKIFDTYDAYTVRVGEETGQLVAVLQQLADYYQTRVAFKRKVVGALSYPIVVLFTALLVVTFMLNFVVPMFADIFRQSNAELPGITKGVMAVSDFFRQYILLFLLAVALLVALYLSIRKKEVYRRTVSLFFLKQKYVGEIIRLSYLYRFCKTMVLHTGSGVPLLRTIQLIQRMVAYYPMEQALAKVEREILQGKPLSQSMEGSPMFDRKMVALTRLGEETNRQEMVYTRLAEQYEQQLQQKVGMLSSILEPLILLIVGIIVATILISMYLPMFKLGGAIN